MGQTIKTNSWVPTPRMPRGKCMSRSFWIGFQPDPEDGATVMSSQIPHPDSHQLQNVGDLFFWGFGSDGIMESESATLGDF